MTHWQVRARFENGGVLLFGVEAWDGEEGARRSAAPRLTRFGRTAEVTFTEIAPPPDRVIDGPRGTGTDH
jgi:hypothetical protein